MFSVRRVMGLALLLNIILFSAGQAGSVLAPPEGYDYLSPRPEARYVNPQTTIALRLHGSEELNVLPTHDAFELTGSASGRHSFDLRLALDGETLILDPHQPFAEGEEVNVRFAGLTGTMPAFASSFTISERGVEPMKSRAELRDELFPFLYGEELGLQNGPLPDTAELPGRSELDEEWWPTLLPEHVYTSNGTAQTDYFYLTIGDFSANVFFRFVIDGTSGDIVIWDWNDGPTFDFRYHADHDIMTWFEWPERLFYVADMGNTVIDTVVAGNGYGPEMDFHELLILPNGNRCLMIYDYETVDMSAIVEGGQPDADVIGIVLQELDPDDNVLFEWRSWDHVEITDAVEDVDLTGDRVDYMHTNTIEVDTDGNWIISSRHFNELTKIDRSTGDIIWRLGGENNQFTFVNDPVSGFTGQHDPRRLPNGKLTLFDNGHWHDTPQAAAKEYTIDTTAMTATLDWEYVEIGPSHSQGSTRRLDGGNTLIGWGAPDAGMPHVSEVTASGSEVWSLEFPWSGGSYYSSYRAHESSVAPVYTVPHLEAETFEDGGIRLYFDHFGHDDVDHYEVYTGTSANPTGMVSVSERYYDIPSPGLGQIWYARVKAVNTMGVETGFSEEISIEAGLVSVPEHEQPAQPDSPLLLEAYPNPFNPTATVAVELAQPGQLVVQVYDLLGRSVVRLADGPFTAGPHKLSFDGSGLPSGSYLIEARLKEGPSLRKRVTLVK